jgi:hypothetical protein
VSSLNFLLYLIALAIEEETVRVSGRVRPYAMSKHSRHAWSGQGGACDECAPVALHWYTTSNV